MTTKTALRSRAVTRPAEAGCSPICVACGQPVKFKAKVRLTHVIANVYVDDHWDRVEHYHSPCSDFIGHPYGSAA